MVIRTGSNISSLQAQRRLSETSSTIARTYERLSSGQRINCASDDAAGLAIASSLNVGRRVYAQGVRNLNDGISVLQIADSAVENLSQIVTRIRELAGQAANGTFSSTQREAIDEEASELEKEYFRISKEASFNGMRLFDGSLPTGIKLQAGYGIDGSIQGSLGGVMGDGTFSQKTMCSTGPWPYAVTVGDVNGDGLLDMVTADYGTVPGDNTVSVLIGKGDGTFAGKTSFTTGDNPMALTLGDVNGDGILDIVTADYYDNTASVLIGKGDGTFLNKTSYATGSCPNTVRLGDMNGDGFLDLVTIGDTDSAVEIFTGKGDGTFSAKASFTTDPDCHSLTLGDVNGDEVLDVVVGSRYEGNVNVLLGRGDGTLSAKVSFTPLTSPDNVTLGDLNGDGVLDLITAGNGIDILLGRGDGTFAAKTSFAANTTTSVSLGDVNGDGVLDIAAANPYNNRVSIFLGKGDGTFGPSTSYSTLYSWSVTLGDLNGDGVPDMISAGGGVLSKATIFLSNTREGISPLLPFSLATRADALQAMAPLDRKLAQLSAQRGIIGSMQSRISTAIGTLQSTADNYGTAESRIRDADIAADAAQIARIKISQQATMAILAQANQQPALALRLLQN